MAGGENKMDGITDAEMLSGPSPFQKLFGEGFVGRPRTEENPVGVPTGDPKITSAARRRATRVLRSLHREEFEELMRIEANYLASSESTPKG